MCGLPCQKPPLSPEQGSFHSLSCSWPHVAYHKSQVPTDELRISGLCKEKIFEITFSLASQRVRIKKEDPFFTSESRTANLQPLKHSGTPPAVHSAMVPSPLNSCTVQRYEDLPAQKCCIGANLPALLFHLVPSSAAIAWIKHGALRASLTYLAICWEVNQQNWHQLKSFFHAISWKASNDLLLTTTCMVFLGMQPSRTRQKSLETCSLFWVWPLTGQRGH